MGYPTKIQLIAREKGNQWYVNFPNALAEAMASRKAKLLSGKSNLCRLSECFARMYGHEKRKESNSLEKIYCSIE